MAGPRGRDRHAAPPSAVRWRRKGTGGPPPLPPPSPSQAQARTETDRRNGGPAPPPKRPLHPGCGGTTVQGGARTPCLMPADGGLAAPRTAQTDRPFQRPARGRRGCEPGRGGSLPLPPPPRRTDPLAADRTAPDARGGQQPPRHEYTPGGGTPETTDGRPTPDGAGGRRGGPANPPPPAPPQLGSHRSPPSPRRDRDAGGGDASGPAHRAPQRLQPPAPAGVAANRQAHGSAPEQRADETWGRRTAAHQNSMRGAPPMTVP